MSLLIECVRRQSWRPRYHDGKPLVCETLSEACRTMKELLWDGEEACVRARTGDNILLWGCRHPDGRAMIGGPKGLSNHDPFPKTPTC
jgi:hypothetical protein